MRLPASQTAISFPPPRPRRGFTLVEMLVVIALIGVMIGLVAPTLHNFGRASNLTIGGNMVSSLTALARQRAIAKGTMTALVLLTDFGSEADYRAFGVFEYAGNSGWLQVGKWETMPEGIVVDRSNTDECSFLKNSPRQFPMAIDFRGQPVKAQDPSGYAARIFLPTGSLQNPEYPAQIRLVEGYLQGGAVIYTRRGQPGRDEAGKPVNYYDLAIVGTTGTTKISRP